MQTNKVIRCFLTDVVAATALIFFSVVLTRWANIPPAALLIQLLGIELLSQAFPLATLNDDSGKLTPRRLRQVRIEIVTYGILSGLIAYAGYLLFFGYHAISPAYVDTGSPLYMQATTVAAVTFAMCEVVNLIFVRADNHKHVLSEYLFSNEKLLKSLGVSAFLILNFAYNPWLQSVFNTESLGVASWAVIILCTGIYALCRRLQRYTRKHTRHEVVKLHKEVNDGK